ncbi:hypothetical protein SAMN05428945_6823 [Streptomyces sp. 2224.1]|nr:hypothetical protein SAMN05428945_6823 [Streptomyces sp. 2224.1]
MTTLAEDVRVLREQVKAEGVPPAEPDPSRAVKDLSDRAESVPGTPGRPGESGAPGRPGKNGRDGYSLQALDYDPDALVCRKDAAPPPDDEPTSSPSVLRLPADRRRS